MENLKKLSKTDLKKVKGGNAPVCEPGLIACRHRAENDIPAYWTCEPSETGCRF